MRKHARRKRHNQNTAKRAVLGTALGLGIAALGYGGWNAMAMRSPDQYGCFEDLPQPQFALAIDASMPRWNSEQQLSLRRYVDQSSDSLSFNEKLNVYTTEQDVMGTVLSPRFHVCGQARTSAELEAVNATGGTPGYLKKQRQRLYDEVLAPELDALLSLTPDPSRLQQQQSPLLELIADLSRDHLKPGDHLTIISDLIQNSDSFQFCRSQNHMPAFEDFKKRKIYQSRLKPQSLEGITVEVLMLQRFGFGQSDMRFCASEDELRQFWEDYWIDNGVSDPKFIRIRLGMTGQ